MPSILVLFAFPFHGFRTPMSRKNFSKKQPSGVFYPDSDKEMQRTKKVSYTNDHVSDTSVNARGRQTQ
jgi:hypothetical protein